jgi:site-specific recombinase XerD
MKRSKIAPVTCEESFLTTPKTYSNEQKLTSSLDHDLLSLQSQFFQHLRQKGRSANTLKNYKTDLQCFNTYLSREKSPLNVLKMDIPQVQLYGDYLQNKYNSDNSRRRRVQALRLFFDFLVQEKIVSSNPVRQIPTSPKFLDRPRPTPMVDLKTLWQYLLEEGHSRHPMTKLLARRNQVMILLIYTGALKVSDLAQLKRKQIQLPKDESDDPRVLLTPSKRDPYTVPLCQAFVPVYEEYCKELDIQQISQELKFDQLLFNANPYRILSGGLSSRGIEVIFEDWRNRLMVEVTAKSLRQSGILHWLQKKREDILIKEWMGVAPSYSLKLYKEHIDQHVFDDSFLLELYYHYKKHNYERS